MDSTRRSLARVAEYLEATLSKWVSDSRADGAHFEIVIVSSLCLILLLFVNILLRFNFYGEVSGPAVVAIGALALIPLFTLLKRDRSKWAGVYFSAVGLVGVPLAAFQEGGLLSIPILWLPVVPIIAVFFSGIFWGLVFAFLSVFILVSFVFIHLSGNFGSLSVISGIDSDVAQVLYGFSTLTAVIAFTTTIATLSKLLESYVLERVRSSEVEFRSLAANLPAMVWRIDAKGELVFGNDCTQRFLNDRSLRSLRKIIHRDDLRAVVEQFQKSLHDFVPLNLEFRCYGPREQLHWLSCSGSSRSNSGWLHQPGIVGVCRDITAAKSKEADLRAEKTKSDEANAAKSKYLADLSHEIRTPLGVILGFSEILMEDRKIPQTGREYLQAIDQNARHLLGLMNQVLELSKIEAGAASLEKKPFPFIEEMKAILVSHKLVAKQRDLDLEIYFDPTLFMKASPKKANAST